MTTKTPLPSLADILVWPPGQAPWAKQEEAHQLSSDQRLFALLMEMRTGKTIVTLGTCAYQYSRFVEAGGFGKPTNGEAVFALLPKRFREGSPSKVKGKNLAPRISDLPKDAVRDFVYRPKAWATKGMDALVVVALPSGVPMNWAEEASLRLPKSMDARILVWDSDRNESAEFAREFRDLLCHEGFAILLMNGEALTTATGKTALGAFLRARRAITVGDETSLICSQPGNARSLVMEALRKMPGAICRRILDGSPFDESPLDAYSQMRFLDWQILGFDSWTAFKNFYASWETVGIWVKDPKTGKPVERAVKKQITEETSGKKVFANLDVMGRKLAPVSFRVKRTDCFDIPEKVRTRYWFEMSAAQRAVYDPLFEEFEAFLRDGSKVTAKHVLARMVRLDQVRGNWWPPAKVPQICEKCEGDGCQACGDVGAIIVKTAKKVIDPDRNPLIEAFSDVLSVNKEPGVFWAVFDETIDAMMEAATKAGRNPVRYDGLVDDKEKLANLKAFQAGHSGLMVAKEASAGRGLNLSAARWLAYLESSHSKRKRSQSEDRAEVSGREFGTGIIDVVSRDSHEDEKKLRAHFNKGAVSEELWDMMRRAA